MVIGRGPTGASAGFASQGGAPPVLLGEEDAQMVRWQMFGHVTLENGAAPAAKAKVRAHTEDSHDCC